MKKIKRISIEFRHREITIAVGGATLHVQDGESDAMNPPAYCPTCGSPWIAIVASAAGDVSASAEDIRRILQQSGLHMQVSPAGLLQICRRSLEGLKDIP